MGIIYQTRELCWYHTREQLTGELLHRFISINDPPFGNGWTSKEFEEFVDPRSHMFFYAVEPYDEEFIAFGAIQLTNHCVTVHNFGISPRFQTAEMITKLHKILEEIRPCHQGGEEYLRGVIFRVRKPTAETLAFFKRLNYSISNPYGEVAEIYK